MKIETLKDSVALIKKLGAEVGLEIKNDEIAKRVGLTDVRFERYLNGTVKTPNKIFQLLVPIYEEFMGAVQRKNRSARLKHFIELVKNRGKSEGMDIGNDEIILKLSIPGEQFEAYLSGEIETSENGLGLFWTAWPDIFKNIRIIRSVTTESIGDGEQSAD